MAAEYVIEKIANDETGVMEDCVVEHDRGNKDILCTILELNKLFDACTDRWGREWDLNKVITAIRECEFD